MPNGPNKGCLFASSTLVPNTCPFESVCYREEPSPFVRATGLMRGGLRRLRVTTYLVSVVQKQSAIFPGPSFRVPVERDPIAIEEGGFMFLLASSDYGNPHFMVGLFKFPFRLLPLLKAPWLWANFKTLDMDWKDQTGFPDIVGVECDFIFKINHRVRKVVRKKTDPSAMCDLLPISFNNGMPFMHKWPCDEVPSLCFIIHESKFLLGLLWWNELTKVHIPNIIHRTHAVSIEFSSACIWKSMSDELDVPWPPYARMRDPIEIFGWQLDKWAYHVPPSFSGVPPNFWYWETLVFGGG